MKTLRMKWFLAVLSVLIGSAAPVQADVLFQQMPGPLRDGGGPPPCC